MKPIALRQEGVDLPVAWRCSKCGAVHSIRSISANEIWPPFISRASKAMAERCCEPPKCRHCGKTDVPVNWGHEFRGCEECYKAYNEKIESAQVAAAKHVSWKDWDGPMFMDGRMFHGADAVHDHFSGDDPEDRPEWLWGSSRVPFALDSESILQQAGEDMGLDEDGENAISVITTAQGNELQALLNSWVASVKVDWYEMNTGVVVELDGLWDGEP